jgi:hypothetical protein
MSSCHGTLPPEKRAVSLPDALPRQDGHWAALPPFSPLSSIRILHRDPVFAVFCEMLSESTLTTNQSHKLSRLPVREPPGLPARSVLDDDTATLARSDFKRARRKRYGHCTPPYQGDFPVRNNVACLIRRSGVTTQPIRRAADPPPLLNSLRGDTHHDPHGRRKAAARGRLRCYRRPARCRLCS